MSVHVHVYKNKLNVYMTWVYILKKVNRLSKELCRSNETWHALNSTFPDTNCIVSFQIQISNSEFWKVVLETFREWPGKLMKRVLFHQDNAPEHKSVVAMAAVHDCGFESVDHPPYSPDMVPSDYFLFPNMKKKIIVQVKQDSLCQFFRPFTKCLLYYFSKSWITYPVWVYKTYH